MQCVILAAGEGTRLRPLTLEVPKSLVRVADVPIIEYIVRALPDAITELVIVVGYKGEMIREYCGSEFLGRSVTYVHQENPKGGTADALFCAQSVLHDTFLVMYGDDIHGSVALAKVVALPHAALAARSETPERFGVLECNPDGTLARILEKPEIPPSNLINIGGFVLTEDIFSYQVPQSVSGEYYLTDCITAYAGVHPVQVIEQDTWMPIGYLEDIEKAECTLTTN